MSIDPTQKQVNITSQERQRIIEPLLPKGACLISEHVKYQYIKKFISDQEAHLYILPINSLYSPFVVIKSFLKDQSTPIYSMYYHPTKTFLLAAQEQNLSIGANYIISKCRKPEKDNYYVGKLRGNFNRNQFNIFDSGDNPGKIKNKARKQLGFIKKQQGSMWESKGDKISFIVPKPQEIYQQSQGIHRYQPIQFVCNSSQQNPLFKDYSLPYNNVEYLESKELTGKRSKIRQQTFTLLSSIKSQSINIKKRSQTYFQLSIGCPLTIVQGFAFLLALIQCQCL